MEPSILKSTKKILGISPDDDSFDLDVITHINSEFSVLHDLGVGPEAGFVIEDEYVNWETYLSDDPIKLSKVKTCVWLRARLLFDPPLQSFLIAVIQEQLREAEWRLNTNREAIKWVDPDPPTVLVGDGEDPAGP
jgi:hypothetical protein